MTKKTSHYTNQQKPPMPFVSVCTPTFNRRPFIPIMFDCFRNQRYPKHRIEWIIIDDGTDKIKDLVDEAKIPQIKYFAVDKKMTLGAKRNMMHDKSKGSIIVYMDDDDYYPPERIMHAVETLQANPKALCAGTSEIYLYFKQIKKMYQFGPYNQTHATAATFAFRRDLLSMTRYDDKACLAEERHFLKEYTIPFVQLDPLKTILVFSHEHNSFDKRKLLENPHPQFVKESTKTVDMFIRTPGEQNIKKFFMEDIDQLLKNYKPGEPIMKQDVLKQMREIDEERKKMAAADAAAAAGSPQYGGAAQPQIMMQEPGKEPVAITLADAVNIINQQQQHIKHMEEQIKRLESKNAVAVSSPPIKVAFSADKNTLTDASVLGSDKAEVAKLREKIRELENHICEMHKDKLIKTNTRSQDAGEQNSGVDASEVGVRSPDASKKSKTEPEFMIDVKSSSTIVSDKSASLDSNKSSNIVIPVKSKLEPEFRL